MSSLAYYLWGSHVIRFSGISGVDQGTLKETLGSLMAKRAPWRTRGEFVGVVALLHELVHYYQDLLTGVGHNDHIWRLDRYQGTGWFMREFGNGTRPLPFSPNGNSDPATSAWNAALSKVSSSRANYEQELLAVDERGNTPEVRIQALANFLANAPEFNGSDPRGLTVARLLEAEAVATVHLTLLGLECTSEQEAIKQQRRFFFMPDLMPVEYIGSLMDFFMAVYDEEDKNEMSVAVYASHLRMFIFIVDLACAYPPALFMQGTGLPELEFLPGVKFARLLEAIHRMNGPDLAPFLNALVEDRADEAERVLLDACKVKYPTTGEIYAAWIQTLERHPTRRTHDALSARLNACRNRAESNSIRKVEKSLRQLIHFNADIPIAYLHSGGMTMYGMNEQAIPPVSHHLVDGILAWNSITRVEEMHFSTGSMQCPFIEANACSIATGACSALTALRSIPTDQRCALGHITSNLKNNES